MSPQHEWMMKRLEREEDRAERAEKRLAVIMEGYLGCLEVP